MNSSALLNGSLVDWMRS